MQALVLHNRKGKQTAMAAITITPELIAETLAARAANTKTRKVSDEEVRLIRTLDANGLKNGEIAKLVGLPPQYVSHIRRGKSYKDVIGQASIVEATATLNELAGDEDADVEADADAEVEAGVEAE